MKICILQLTSFACFLSTVVETSVDFTNIQCEVLNEAYIGFEYCYIKAVNRSYKYVSARAKLVKVPVDNATVQVALFKKANGYKPFLLNVTVDACEFLRKRKNSAALFFYQIYEPYSNVNHTCPYSEDIIIDKLPSSHIQHMLSNVLVVPPGEYAVFSKWYIFGVRAATVKVYAILR